MTKICEQSVKNACDLTKTSIKGKEQEIEDA